MRTWLLAALLLASAAASGEPITDHASATAAPAPFPGGALVLFFDNAGTLTRRLEAD